MFRPSAGNIERKFPITLNVPSNKILDRQALQRRVAEWRHQGQTVVLANGCFDLLHVGHIRYLRAARALGGRLVVAVNSDASARRLKGEGRPDSLMFRPDKFYRDQNIELIGDRAAFIDRAARRLVLASGSFLDYGHLVLATGARNRLLDIPNANLADVRYLRNLDESEALRQRIATASHVVVIGAGFIGLEFAATARAKGLPGRTIVLRHALRNALIPMITILAPQIPNLITGTIFVEVIFRVPGLGKFFVSSIYLRDYPMIMATMLLVALLWSITYLLSDILYTVVDPRIRLH